MITEFVFFILLFIGVGLQAHSNPLYCVHLDVYGFKKESFNSSLLAVNKMLSNSFLNLSEDKTEILLVSPKTRREMLFNILGN